MSLYPNTNAPIKQNVRDGCSGGCVQCVSEMSLQPFRCGIGKLIKSRRRLRHAMQLTLLLGLALLTHATDARADTIVQYCVGCTGNGSTIQFPGQSVTT